MKRRNILHTGMAAMLLLSVSACEDFKFGNDFLDKPITTDVTIDTVFSRKVYAEQALAEIYRSLTDFLPTGGRLSWATLECMTDLVLRQKLNLKPSSQRKLQEFFSSFL